MNNQIKNLNDYIIFLHKKNLSAKTIRQYSNILKKIKIETADYESIKSFLINPNLTAATQTTYKSAIIEYLKFVNNQECLNELKFLKLKKQGIIYRPVISKDEIYRRTKVQPSDKINTIKTKIITKFLFETGIRVNELKNINYKKENKNPKILVKGKGNKVREIFFLKKTVNPLLKFFPELKIEFNYWKLIRDMKKLLGDDFACHTLRRSFATYMLTTGANPKMVQLQMGHSNIDTTFRYLNLSREINKKIYQEHFSEDD